MDRDNYSIPTTREEAIAFRAIQWTRGKPAVKRVQAEAEAVKFLGPKPPKDPAEPKVKATPKDSTVVASTVAASTASKAPVRPQVIAKTPPTPPPPSRFSKFASAEEEMEWADHWRTLVVKYDPTFAPGKVW